MRAIFTIVAAMAATSAFAGDLEATVDRFERTENGASELVIRFTNNSAKIVKYAGVNCALLDKDDIAITTVGTVAQNIEVGGRAFSSAFGPRDPRVARAECRVLAVDYTD